MIQSSLILYDASQLQIQSVEKIANDWHSFEWNDINLQGGCSFSKRMCLELVG